MALNLNKGGRFNLAKEAPQLRCAGVGLGWKPNTNPNGPDFDLDVSAFLITETGKVPADEYVVFYNSELKMDTNEGKRPYSGDGSVLGAVDEQGGSDDEGIDAEDMRIYFEKVWQGITEIVITVSITKYPNDAKKDKRTLLQNFGMVDDCYVRVWDEDTGNEILRYNLKEQFTNEDAVEFCRFIRVNNSWEFVATATKYTGSFGKLIEIFA